MKKIMFIMLVVLLLVFAGCTMEDIKDKFIPDKNQKVLEQIKKENDQPRQVVTTAKPSNPQADTSIKISVEQMQALVDKTPAFRELPKNSAFVFAFFEGNGLMRNDMSFSVQNGKVTTGTSAKYDFKFITGDYWYKDFESAEDLCSVMQKIRDTKDYRFERKIGVFEAGIKYAGMLKYKSCLGM